MGHPPPLHWFGPRSMCANTKTTRDYATPPYLILGPLGPRRGRKSTGYLHHITLPSEAQAQLTEYIVRPLLYPP